jgi:hypothetical protein
VDKERPGEMGKRLTDKLFTSSPAAIKKFGARPGFQPGHDVASIKTYRYLRLGMLAAAAALAYSLLEERYAHGVSCFLGSISGYYYTPVHPVFVGVLAAIGLALIVIKGRTVIEDTCLSLAGVMAPIVALIPTTDDTKGVCRAEMISAGHYLPPASDVRVAAASISNGLRAYLIAGTVAIGLLGVAALAQWRRSKRSNSTTTMKEYTVGTWWGLGGATVLVGVGWLLLVMDYGWVLDGHARAASAMIAFLAIAAIVNGILGIWKKYGYTRFVYAVAYLGIGVSMLVGGVVFIVYRLFNSSALHGHLVLAIEVVELALFVAFWSVQTIERWNQTT